MGFGVRGASRRYFMLWGNRRGLASDAGNFVRAMIERDAKLRPRVQTRFPPEPSGYLHLGHAKAIWLNFSIAEDHSGAFCTLRFDDSNPESSTSLFADSIREDVKWLGYCKDDRVNFTSNYFQELYEIATRLVKDRKAYVCSLSSNEWFETYLGSTLDGVDGKVSPYFYSRSVEENLALLEEMRMGKYADGTHVLRARIDMSSPDINMRDPVLYRIKNEPTHFRTGREWKIYPSYDFSHCLSDAMEGVTHSLCTLEFESHRGIYDWLLDAVGFDVECRPYQTEFARLNLSHTVMSKRLLRQLVDGGVVDGWDDPRMPTLAGMRRRGIPPEAVVDFCTKIGVSRVDSVVDIEILNSCVRKHLDRTADRVMCVLNPVRVVLTNVDNVRDVKVPNHPKLSERGHRTLSIGREIFIDRDDFLDTTSCPKTFKRLTLDPSRSVRLRGAGIIVAKGVEYDDQGRSDVIYCELHANDDVGIPKPRGVIHWVCADTSDEICVVQYDHLFHAEKPIFENGTLDRSLLNEDSVTVLEQCRLERSDRPLGGDAVQFEREGYYVRDTKDKTRFNRTISLRSSV